MKWILSAVLAAIPVVAFYLQRRFSEDEGKLEALKNHAAAHHIIWLWIPFNFLLPSVVDISWWLYVILSIAALFGAAGVFYYWLENQAEYEGESFVFDALNNAFTKSGRVFFLFTMVESVLVMAFLISTVFNWETLAGIGLLTVFFFSLFWSSRKIHGKILVSDAVIASVGLLACGLKLVLI